MERAHHECPTTGQTRASRILLEERLSHSRQAGAVWLLGGQFHKGLEQTRGAGDAAHHAMSSPGEQEEGAPGERARGQHPVGRRRRRVVLAGQDQCGDGAGDGLPLRRGHRLDMPELAIGVDILQGREKVNAASPAPPSAPRPAWPAG